jgi:hypothetical protein
MSAQPLNREQWLAYCATLAQSYERAMNSAERNAEILRRARAGENSAALAAEYGLSRVYLDRIVHAPMPWEEIGLDVRVYTCLRSLGVDPTDIDAITRLSPAKLLRQPNFGARSLGVLRDYLRKHGRDFDDLSSPQLAVTTPEQARRLWAVAVIECDRANQAVTEALELCLRLEREAAQHPANITQL